MSALVGMAAWRRSLCRKFIVRALLTTTGYCLIRFVRLVPFVTYSFYGGSHAVCDPTGVGKFYASIGD